MNFGEHIPDVSHFLVLCPSILEHISSMYLEFGVLSAIFFFALADNKTNSKTTIRCPANVPNSKASASMLLMLDI